MKRPRPDARSKRDAAIRLLIPLLSDKPDVTAVSDFRLWQAIRRQAAVHGVAPLIAFAARLHVQGEERVWCDRVLATSWSRHNRNLADLEFVAAALGERGIRPLALKGPVLASRHYNPPFLRKPSIDLDLGIRDSEMDSACAALEKAGYSPETTLKTARAFSHHIVMCHPGRARVELHFRISHGAFGLPVDEFISQAAPWKLEGGAEVLVLEGAAEIFHLAVHITCGRFFPFFHLYELRRISRAAGPELVRRAAARAAENHFAGAFALIDAAFQHHWGEPFLPADFPMPPTWLAWRINERLYRDFGRWGELKGAHPLRSRLWGRWLDIQTTDRPSDAIRHIGMLTRFAWFQLQRRPSSPASG